RASSSKLDPSPSVSSSASRRPTRCIATPASTSPSGVTGRAGVSDQRRSARSPRTFCGRVAITGYRKVGFRPVGVMRQYERGPEGEWHDGLLMDLLAGELT